MTERKTQKARSHARIVRHAARLFRERGVGGVGVDELMSAAGLTHGAFYAHFRDKNALVSEALAAAFDQARRNLFDAFPDARGASWLALASDRYLAPEHLVSPGSGCAVPALAAELSRATPALRRTFTEQVKGIATLAEERIGASNAPAGRPDDAAANPRVRRRALSALATWAGAIALARAVDDPTLADEILAACREAVTAEHTPAPIVAPPRKRATRAPKPTPKRRPSRSAAQR